MLFSGENFTNSLFFAANVYKSRNWSVIPLIGNADSTRAKHPAIKWGRYQHTHPTDDDLHNWFLVHGFAGLGIVLGAVSRLVVLDFDDPDEASEFRRLMPNLIQTRMVESGTRKLPHYYYALPDDLKVYSRHVPGIDLRADGAYVVAPPTCVGDQEWRLVQDDEIHRLDGDDLKAILRFMAKPAPSQPEISLKPPSRTIKGQQSVDSDPLIFGVQQDMSSCRNSDASFDPVALYHGMVTRGRNNALFEVAMLARDRGWKEDSIRQALANVHALQSDVNGEREAFAVRYAEAVSTIGSVFTRPVRLSINDDNLQSDGTSTLRHPPGLPVILREWLLRHGLVAAARVLDGLYLAGLQPGSIFTERMACSLLSAYQIGRRSIMAALRTVLPNGDRLFQVAAHPPMNPRTDANAATRGETEETKCDLVTGADRVKKLGRPASHYIFPDTSALAKHAAVGIPTLQPYTGLQPEDLSSPAAYRRSLHRELITRRPGQYTRRWLATRLGISRWTCRRYDSTLGMVVHPMYSEQRVTWASLNSVLPTAINQAQPGTFLEIAGKRYPPLQCIAARVLEKGGMVMFKRRMANYYTFTPASVGIPTLQPQSNRMPHSLFSCSHQEKLTATISIPDAPSQTTPTIQEPDITTYHKETNEPDNLEFWLCPGCMKTRIQVSQPATCDRCSSHEWEHIPRIIWRDQDRLKHWWQSCWRDKHPTAPRKSTPLVTGLKRRNSDGSGVIPDKQQQATCQRLLNQIPGLSRHNAARLVDRYSIPTIERCLALITTKGYIRNPAGFLITLLNSEHKFCKKVKDNGVLSVNSSTKKSAAAHQDTASWVHQMAASPYVDFLVNVDDFVST